MQRHILRQLPRAANAHSARTIAKATATNAMWSRQFASHVPVKQTNLLINGNRLPDHAFVAREQLKRVTLELGGKSANIICDDADIDQAIAQSQLGLFFNMGQACMAGSRLYVQEGIYDEFVRRSMEAAKARIVGDPFSVKTDQGPQIDRTQFEKILNYISIGKKEGAKILTGGKRVGNKGFFIEPTVFADVEDDMTIAREEIFGPVMTILKFKTIDEVIKRANDSSYGLAAGIVTKSVDNAIKISNGIRTGLIFVNCYHAMGPNTPYGGFKDSGIGRENGEHGLHGYLENKTVIIKRPDDSMP
uniref:Aldehyde dehydrogenase domain-containing protein n=1 Tax=Globisporangium ultimum (strain ATCC 200006 / CBS 805.95 / DAOM BR144) TaxID=431595 RepID=K3X1G4_GLOUD